MKYTVQNTLRSGDRFRYAIKRYQGIAIETELADYAWVVERIKSTDYGRLSDSELRARAYALRSRLREGAPCEELLPEIFAAVGEAARRTLGFDLFDEQLVAGAREISFSGHPSPGPRSYDLPR